MSDHASSAKQKTLLWNEATQRYVWFTKRGLATAIGGEKRRAEKETDRPAKRLPTPPPPAFPAVERSMPDYASIAKQKFLLWNETTQQYVELTLSPYVYGKWISCPDRLRGNSSPDASFDLKEVDGKDCDHPYGFTLEFFDKGKWSYLAQVNVDSCNPQKVSGAVLMELLDRLNMAVGVEYCWLLDVSTKTAACTYGGLPVADQPTADLPLAMLNLLTTGKRWYSKYGFVPDNQMRPGIVQAMGTIHRLQNMLVSDVFPRPESALRSLLDPSGTLKLKQALILLKENAGATDELPTCRQLGTLASALDYLEVELGLSRTFLRKQYNRGRANIKLVDEYAPVEPSTSVMRYLARS